MDRLIKFFFTFGLIVLTRADTPANCTLDDLLGRWNFYVYSGGHDKHVDCSNPGSVQLTFPMTFSGVNTVTKDTDAETGKFNLIYNQGFEAVVGYRKFFAFFKWQNVDANQTMYWCDQTMNGWSHDVLGNDWACFHAVKQKKLLGSLRDGVLVKEPKSSPQYKNLLKQNYKIDKTFIANINERQKSWVAGYYPHLDKMTYRQVLMRSGYGNGPIVKPNFPRKIKFESDYGKTRLPESFDWRKVNGQNFVSPIRNQADCGSCYAFASMAMLEARVRIMTNNTQQPVFSPQDVISCGEYSQGCDGGFAYLIAGKYAQDFGVVNEQCYPYVGQDTPQCTPAQACKRTYVADYEYVGGYYGACTENKMKEALVAYGPIAVGIEVYEDLQLYKGGIYHHVTGLRSSMSPFNDVDPFQLTNHAVLVVGYGADPKTGEKFWIVKNSWGKEWGEDGFFRVRRGTDEVAIESIAMQSIPIPQLQ